MGKLPGHRRASFVRRRRYRERSTFCELLRHVFAPSGYSSNGTRLNKMRSWRRPEYYDSDYDYDYYPRRRQRHYYRRRPSPVPFSSGAGRVATTMQQTCSACGKFRSPSWQARNPLVPGEVPPPTMCRSCRDKRSSSEESDCFCGKPRKHKHRRHYCTNAEVEDECSHASTCRHSRRRRCQHSHATCALNPPLSRESINVFVDSDAGARSVRPIISEPATSTDDDVEVVRQVLPRTRSSSSILLSDLEQPRIRRRRSTSNVRVVRSRSPLSPLSPRYVDEIDLPRRRRYRRGSRVSFVDDPEEVVLSRRGSTRRRSRVYYDGADSGYSEEMNNHAVATRSDTSETSDNISKSSLEDPSARDYSMSSESHHASTVSSIQPPSIDRASNVSPSSSHADRTTDPSHDHSPVLVRSDHHSSLRHTPPDETARPASVSTRPKDHRTTSMTPPLKHFHSTSAPTSSKRESSTDPPLIRPEVIYRHVSPSPSLLHPADPSNEPARPSTPLLPDDPNHPDHLIWLLSSQHISPIQTARGEWEYLDNRASDSVEDTTPPATPTDTWVPLPRNAGAWAGNGYVGGEIFKDEGYGTGNSFDSSEDYGNDDDGHQGDDEGWSGGKNYGYGKDDFTKGVSEMEYEEAAYWERMGREYLDSLRRARAEAYA